jgi:hypothetical protein
LSEGHEKAEKAPKTKAAKRGVRKRAHLRRAVRKAVRRAAKEAIEKVAEARRRGPGGKFMKGSAPPKPIYSWTDSEEE